MKVAINITREALGGITTTNLNLLDELHGSNGSFVGIELNAFRTFKAATLFRHLSPDWFTHHIVSLCDYSLGDTLKKASSLKEMEMLYKPIIDIVRGILRKEKPDVMLINGTYYIPWILSIACSKEKIPVVLWYAGVLSRETSHFKYRDRKIMADMERSVVRRAKRIMFPSELCKNTVLSDVVNTQTVRDAIVLPNPISPIFTQADRSDYSVDKRIAFVGRFSRIKRPREFIRLHKILLKSGWEHEATMVTDLHSKADLKLVPKTINLLPSMPPEQLKKFYATQGLVVCPSAFETFGNVPIEAACTGIPVLVHENMGCTDVLRDANLGKFVVNFDDTELAIKRIKELCGQNILNRQMNNLRKRVDVRFIAQEIIGVLHRAVEEK